jgi:hypothetical protein
MLKATPEQKVEVVVEIPTGLLLTVTLTVKAEPTQPLVPVGVTV